MNKHSYLQRLFSRALLLIPLLLLGNVAHATTYYFTTTLASESSPPNPLGTGWAQVVFDDVAQTMRVLTSYSGLTTPVTAAHIHAATAVANAGTASVATQTPSFTGFPTTTSGTYDNVFDLSMTSSFRAGYITANGGTAAAASQALLTAILAEKTYLNIHTERNPSGEIRGFLHLASVPDSGTTMLLLTLGLGAMAGIARRRNRLA